MKHTIQLDVAHDGQSLESALHALVEDSGCTTRVVDPEGPGGGWPVISFRGRIAGISLILHRYHDEDDYNEQMAYVRLAEALGKDVATLKAETIEAARREKLLID